MSDTPTPPEAPTPSFAEITRALRELPRIRTKLSPAEFTRCADAASKAGKLPGFETEGALFTTLLFGAPFDRVMSTAAKQDGEMWEYSFSVKMLPKMPLIFAAVTAFSIWPGVTLTHSFLRTYFTWYTIQTWWWYIPVTVLPLPWMGWKMVKKSEASCLVCAHENVQLLAERCGGEIV